MIIDAHTHAFARWPFGGDVPNSCGDADALMREMDAAGVDKALVVCAAIGSGQNANPNNNAYVAGAASAHPDRLEVVADVDSRWSTSYHRSGAPGRLDAAVGETGAVGVTHYLDDAPDDWFRAGEGVDFLRAAHRSGVFLSLHARPAWFDQLGDALAQVPDLPVLIHHQGHLEPNSPAYADQLSLMAGLARLPEVRVKVSGFHHLGDLDGAYPFASTHRALLDLLKLFGVERLLWGSDYPVSREHLTYPQTIEILDHFDLDEDGRRLVMGANAARLLASGRP